jgi:hypothetical protein
MLQMEPELKRLFAATTGDQISPELMSLNKRHSELMRQLETLKGR